MIAASDSVMDAPAGTTPSDQPFSDARLERWLAALLSTPGLTAIRDPEEARRVHVEDALAAHDLLELGPVIDVGSGGGSPGIPLAAARPDLQFVLLESQRRKCAFLEEATRDFDNASVVCARAEDYGRDAGRDAYGTALARALARPPVAAEWCLPLVAPGGAAILFVGPSVRVESLARVSAELGGGPPEKREGLLVLPKVEPTPSRFPRRPGLARKRPLA
jgi:16S rRNA (guanine527-N7)-methyltransferase